RHRAGRRAGRLQGRRERRPGCRADDLSFALAHPRRKDSGTGMTLIDRMETELKEAMLEHDRERRDALRLLLASLRAAEKDLQRRLCEAEDRGGVRGERRGRIEAAEAFGGAWGEEQGEKEERELAVLEESMPEPLSEAELEEIVDDAIAEVGATSLRQLGRVMADVMPQVAGRADGSTVSQLVREKLA